MQRWVRCSALPSVKAWYQSWYSPVSGLRYTLHHARSSSQVIAETPMSSSPPLPPALAQFALGLLAHGVGEAVEVESGGGPVLGGEEDLKGLAVLLASEASRHITGQAIAVDGGATII